MDRAKRLTVDVARLAVALFFSLALAPWPATADMQGKQLLDDLIAKAKKEGALDTAFVSQAGPSNPALIRAFKQRFGLDDIEINISVGRQDKEFAQLKAKLMAGVPPTVDSLTGSEEHVTDAMEHQFINKIDNWQSLLAEVNPLVRSGTVKPDLVSPAMLSGHGFIWGNRTKALVYNPKLISEKDLPQSHTDLANPKLKGQFLVAPWLDEWLLGLLVHKDRQEWLQTVDRIGKNARGVLHTTGAVQRLLLGDVAFTPGNVYNYYQSKDKDPQAPVAVRYWNDYTGVTRISYVVAKGARHPAAATLWNLWMTTPEAEAIWQPVALYENVSFGQSDYDKAIRAGLEKAKSPVMSFWDNAETRKILEWLNSPEGQQYTKDIGKAATQRKTN
ncbi:MAG TPA: extracellular solute-binding protein [Candidatus Binatia bacterium]